jgi:hypothetical protein
MGEGDLLARNDRETAHGGVGDGREGVRRGDLERKLDTPYSREVDREAEQVWPIR